MLEAELMTLKRPCQELDLLLPGSSATVSLTTNEAGRYQVMLDVKPANFVAPPEDLEGLLRVLGLGKDALATELPPETAKGDFIHLVVPLTGLEAMRAIKPDFPGMIEFCHANGIETIAVFCSAVENPQNTIHVRDFCPAVGVSESAAAGTTNAALASYLVRHKLVPTNHAIITVNDEQGLELGRPSAIKTIVTLSDGEITRLQVGGVATRIMDGRIYL